MRETERKQSMSSGTIIFLNGSSSAGKTSLAHALQEILPDPYQHIALDQFRDGMSAKFRGLNSPTGTRGQRGLNIVPHQDANGTTLTEVRFGEEGKRLLRGMRRAIVALADAGNSVIIDDILFEPDFLEDYLAVTGSIPVYFVGVRCPLKVINDREQVRLGRFPGTAESHFVSCHAHNIYDIEVHTDKNTPAECANQVITRMLSGLPTAFNELRAIS